MSQKVLLVTPPFTQLNTPYPATCYLKGFLNSKGVSVSQRDLSIDLFNTIFNSNHLTKIFEEIINEKGVEFTKVWAQRKKYSSIVDSVMQFLRTEDLELAQTILSEGYLPKGHRMETISTRTIDILDSLGEIDKAKHFATLMVEELGDFIQSNIDEFFSFTKYAEQIATSASSFNNLEKYLQYEPTIVEQYMLKLLEGYLVDTKAKLVCFTIPFPGNLFSALRCSQHIKNNFPQIKIAFGGGYCNTELRSLEDPRIFQFVDFISLDDGEGPLLRIVELLNEQIEEGQLERTFIKENGRVVFKNKMPNTIFHHQDLPAPSYSDLSMANYLSFLDIVNPMHRLWSDGRWNKLTIAHGCYWKQCSFCDVNLDYIGNYQISSAQILVNKIEQLINETGSNGFHFVDEAAPPKILREMAKEILARKLKIRWWTNIRFEKTFDEELCTLLARSGCIAVTGGLEVASDRLLLMMSKGVDIRQVARVSNFFSKNNIMVHAYLMYGFPTQSEQETIDALEVVRQLFKNDCIQSGFWHQFTTTIHSPIGKNPEQFGIEVRGPVFQGFAQNDLYHHDPKGAEHEKFKNGLNLALSSYLRGTGFDDNLQNWFDFKIPETKHVNSMIESYIEEWGVCL